MNTCPLQQDLSMGRKPGLGTIDFSLKPHPRRPKFIWSFSGGFGHYWLLLPGQRSCLRHLLGECFQVLERPVLAIALVPFVAFASVVSVLLAGRCLRYSCEPAKA